MDVVQSDLQRKIAMYLFIYSTHWVLIKFQALHILGTHQWTKEEAAALWSYILVVGIKINK